MDIEEVPSDLNGTPADNSIKVPPLLHQTEIEEEFVDNSLGYGNLKEQLINKDHTPSYGSDLKRIDSNGITSSVMDGSR
jgi:hypothetical protein